MIRGIAILTDKSWEYTYMEIIVQGYTMYDMPSSTEVWSAYLKNRGYLKHIIPDKRIDNYTVKDFCYEHPTGRYLLVTGNHVLTVIDGDYYDTQDSGNEIPIYYFTKEEA